MFWHAALPRLRAIFDDDDLGSPLAVLPRRSLPPDVALHCRSVGSGGLGGGRPDGEEQPAGSERSTTVRYLIASRTATPEGQHWTLMGPATEAVVTDDATVDAVVAELARLGWSLVTSSPPADQSAGTVNYIFQQPGAV